MRVLATIALRNLLQARRRSLLLSLAIGLVTMLLVLLLAMSAGIQDNLVRSATTLSAGHVNVAGFYKSTAGDAAPIIGTSEAEVRKIVEENTPGLDYIVDRHRGWGKLIGPGGSQQMALSGLVASEEGRFFDRLQLAKESEYKTGGRDEVVPENDPRKLANPHTIVIFANQAKRIGAGVGDTVTIQTETLGGRTNTDDVTVVGVAEDIGLLSSFSSLVPKDEILLLYQIKEDTTGAIWVYLKDIDQAPAVMDHLRKVFIDKGYQVMDYQSAPFFFKFQTVQGEDWTGQKLDLTIWKDEVSFLTWVITAFDTVTWFLVAILVAIIAVGIMNTMWNAVRERTREVGTMRAIGMTRRRVLGLFLMEALFLGLFATTTGALLGALVAFGVDALHLPIPIDAVKFILLSDHLHLLVRPAAMTSAIAALTLFTTLAALWPAVRAARLRPVTALGHVE